MRARRGGGGAPGRRSESSTAPSKPDDTGAEAASVATSIVPGPKNAAPTGAVGEAGMSSVWDGAAGAVDRSKGVDSGYDSMRPPPDAVSGAVVTSMVAPSAEKSMSDRTPWRGCTKNEKEAAAVDGSNGVDSE